jgi:hypothetical protein
MSGFDDAIVQYICKKLREGVSDAEIMEEVTDSTDPLFISISGDVSLATEYLIYAKAKCAQ